MPSRNDPCPCNSGNKYKRCCWTHKDSPAAKHAIAKAAEQADYERRWAAFKSACEAKGLDPEVEIERLVSKSRSRGSTHLAMMMGVLLGGATGRGRY